MPCTIDIVRIAATIAESGHAVTVDGISRYWGRSYGATHRMVKHAESMGWLELGTLLPTPTGLEVTGRA